jgi:hypothetical protein
VRISPKSVGRHDTVFHYVPFVVVEVLGIELRAFTLSHSTSPIFVEGFWR